MSEDYDDDREADEEPSTGLQAELIKSYAAFGWRSIRSRWPLASAVFALALLLTFAVAKYLPRTYTSRTVLMAVGNPVLDGQNSPNPLAGAESLIMRRENLENLVRETGLVEKARLRRVPLLRLKDQVIAAVFGKPDDATQFAIVVGTLEARLGVGMDQGNLSISADWGDGTTAAEIVEAAREGFIKTRHSAEVSAFEAKMSILDEHATKLRAEVETLAQQINSAHEERAAQVNKAATGTSTASSTVRVAGTRAPSPIETGAPLLELKAKLAEMKKKLADLDAERTRRLHDEQAKLAELKLRLTESHPEVVTQAERVAMASQVPSELALLRSEITDLEGNIREREAMRGSGAGPGLVSTVGTAPGVPALPADIVRALEADSTDPAVSAQLSGAVVRYGELRDSIRSGRIELDTAQAAFSHRYQIVVPAEVPSKPSKPKPLMILGAGAALALLLSLLVPILLQLRNGIMVERWQVHQLQLPVLAELRLPSDVGD